MSSHVGPLTESRRNRMGWVRLALQLTIAWIVFGVLAGGLLPTFVYWVHGLTAGEPRTPKTVIDPRDIVLITAAVVFARRPDLLFVHSPDLRRPSVLLLGFMCVVGFVAALRGGDLRVEQEQLPGLFRTALV